MSYFKTLHRSKSVKALARKRFNAHVKAHRSESVVAEARKRAALGGTRNDTKLLGRFEKYLDPYSPRFVRGVPNPDVTDWTVGDAAWPLIADYGPPQRPRQAEMPVKNPAWRVHDDLTGLTDREERPGRPPIDTPRNTPRNIRGNGGGIHMRHHRRYKKTHRNKKTKGRGRKKTRHRNKTKGHKKRMSLRGKKTHKRK